MNEIVFPAGILQPPFFDPKADPAVNYGAIGVVMGHEITHGFDDKGSQYDGDGNLKDWWTAEDNKAFKAKGDLIANQASEYVVDGDVHLQGKLVEGEAIADLGGVNLAYRAYQKSLEGKPAPRGDRRVHGRPALLPGLRHGVGLQHPAPVTPACSPPSTPTPRRATA